MSIQRCQTAWGVHTVEGWHKVTIEHDCGKPAGHTPPCRCMCEMPDPAQATENGHIASTDSNTAMTSGEGS